MLEFEIATFLSSAQQACIVKKAVNHHGKMNHLIKEFNCCKNLTYQDVCPFFQNACIPSLSRIAPEYENKLLNVKW